ncbi:GntR family transcriptional regulator [Sphingomonas sp. BGYR3]|uniref:GntR family transcriptional regulator n=1 Tax=Sphingomonas sp. BGYR3 TaxID=2975483 RepID=UPI0021A8EAC0|nr:GntR family transcriptional regulator [Sphingomonas sp. BGYR3]MDG5488849.1 GntR family transcriptional regulator [Sphingomonas sp. BGYR3]
MNAAGPTAERVYDAIKAHLLEGRVKPGARLDPAQLADRLHSSVTPVRAALNILVGEGLVQTGTGEGFHLPLIDEPALKDLYAWNADILTIALRAGTGAFPEAKSVEIAQHPWMRPAALFAAIARRSPNLEHARAMAGLNDRLQAVRVAEQAVLPEPAAELDRLDGLLLAENTAPLRSELLRYHRRRIGSAAAILRQLYRMPDANLG